MSTITDSRPAHVDNHRPAILDEPITGSLILRAIKRRWLAFALLLPIIASLIGTATWFLFNQLPINRYSAIGLMHVNSRAPSVISATAEPGADFLNYRTTQALMVKSRAVLTSVLEKPEIRSLRLVQSQSEPFDWLEKELTVDFKLGQEYMRVSMEGREPDEIKAIVSSVVDVYMRDIVNKDKTQKLKRLEHLKAFQSRYSQLLKSKRETVKELAKNFGTTNKFVMAIKQQAAQENLQNSQRELSQLRSELRRLEAETGFIQEKVKSNSDSPIEISKELVEEQLTKDPQVIRFQGEIEKIQQAMEEYKRQAAPGVVTPSFQRMQGDLAATKKSLDDYRKQRAQEVKELLIDKAKKDQALGLASRSQKIEFFQALEKNLEAQAEKIAKDTKDIGLGSVNMEEFQSELQQAEKIAEMIASNIEFAAVELEAPVRVSVYEDVTATPKDLFKTKIKYALIAGLGSLLLMGAGLVGVELRRRRIVSSDELTRGLGMKLIGTIPQVSNSASGGGNLALIEAVDSARTVLLHAAKHENIRAVLISSPLSGEGKTSLVGHFGLSFARAGYRVLLIDADLRRPCLTRIFPINKMDSGVCEVLRGEATLDEVIGEFSTGSLTLSVLPAGQWTNEASHLLATEKWTSLIEDCRSRFDMILIDSSPLLPVTDGLILGQHVDGVILSSMRERSMIQPLYEATQMLNQLGVKVLGVVFNGAMRSRQYGYYYGYNYGYGYGYGYGGGRSKASQNSDSSNSSESESSAE